MQVKVMKECEGREPVWRWNRGFLLCGAKRGFVIFNVYRSMSGVEGPAMKGEAIGMLPRL